MSQIVRQSNLFAAEDFTKIYKSFQDIDFTAYDFDTLKNALIDYIKTHYPEDFNDYVESSEFVAIIELLAYLGTSLAFRVDLNSRENILDTAQRRESIIRLARTINYQPKRNLAANGVFKIESIQTDQLITDSSGNSLQNFPVTWGDPNNTNWFDQFIIVMNNALNPTNPFGRPTKSGSVGSIPTDLYEMNNILGLNVAYNTNININGEDYPFDIVNPDFDDTFFERHPNQDTSFNLIYRNDSLGVNSSDTGFFFYFRQGELTRQDDQFDFPIPNRVLDITAENINQTDVYVQEVNDQGTVETEWSSVPSVSGTNVIYNDIQFDSRDIFEVISGNNDTVSIKYPDGNFGSIPTGIFRTWYRTSAGKNFTMRPEDAQSIQITIPYKGLDSLDYNLTFTFSLEYTVSNSSPAETEQDIKERAPQTYYTQERMVNNEDYNVFPLLYGNEIAKLRSINRTHSGHSRYIDINDPTGFHNNLSILGKDGAIYQDLEPQRDEIQLDESILGVISEEVFNRLVDFMENSELDTFFRNTYLKDFKDENLFGPYYFRLVYNPDDPTDISKQVNYWKTSPDKFENDTGFFIKQNQTEWNNSFDESSDFSREEWEALWPYGELDASGQYTNVITLIDGPYGFIRPGSAITYVDNASMPSVQLSVSVSSKAVSNLGQPVNPAITDLGPVEIGSEVKDLWQAFEVYPDFRTSFTDSETIAILEKIDSRADFSLGYDLDNDEWYVIDGITSKGFGLIADPNDADLRIYREDDISFNNTLDITGALVQFKYVINDGANPTYELISQGMNVIFESYRQVRFYWVDDQQVFDATTGKALSDKITILPSVNDSSIGVPLERSIIFELDGAFVQEDGYQDPSKVKVVPADLNEDGSADNPNSFDLIVGADDYVVFENFIDVDGYIKIRPWVTGWYDFSTLTSPPVVDIPGQTIDGVPLDKANLYNISEPYFNSIVTDLQIGMRSQSSVMETEEFITLLSDISFRIIEVAFDSSGKYRKIVAIDSPGSVNTGRDAESENDENHFEKPGKSFTQDTNVPEDLSTPLFYQWDHISPTSDRIDPAVTNIIDTVLLTNTYYNDVIVWKEERGALSTYPVAPTTEELRIQFGDLDNYKSISDQLIYNSGKFKLLFGEQAEPELQATFKAVKISNSNISDNELKTRIIQAIDEYFEIGNWDFGEQFYYTELAAFIHQRLSKELSSIVIVPTKKESEFGNLFEITSNPDQLFLSTATVANVEIVNNLTETNLRL